MCVKTFNTLDYPLIIVACTLLIVIFIITLYGNIWMLKNPDKNQDTSPNAGLVLSKAIFYLGIVHVCLNIPVYMTSLIRGEWIFGSFCCQIYSLISQTEAKCWFYFLILMIIERYYKIAKKGEYYSLFSVINTKILIWGMVIFSVMISTGPVYGWGVYSDKRGYIELSFQTKHENSSSTEQSRTSLSSLYMDQKYMNIIPSVQTNITTFLQENYLLEVTNILPSESGLTMTIRTPSHTHLDCLWSDLSDNRLTKIMTDLDVLQNVLSLEQFSESKIAVYMSPEDYVIYRNTLQVYQESSTCGIDFTHGKKTIMSYIIFTSIITFLLPLTVMLYVMLKLIRYLTRNMSVRSVSVIHKTQMNMVMAKTCSLSIIIIIGTSICSVLINIKSGLNNNYSKWIYILCYLLSYSNGLIVPLMYKLMNYLGNCGCCFAPFIGNDFEQKANHTQMVPLYQRNRNKHKFKLKGTLPSQSDSITLTVTQHSVYGETDIVRLESDEVYTEMFSTDGKNAV